jgi:hypothetical protein
MLLFHLMETYNFVDKITAYYRPLLELLCLVHFYNVPLNVELTFLFAYLLSFVGSRSLLPLYVLLSRSQRQSTIIAVLSPQLGI